MKFLKPSNTIHQKQNGSSRSDFSDSMSLETNKSSDVHQSKIDKDRLEAIDRDITPRIAEAAGIRFDYTNSFAEVIPVYRGGITPDSWSPRKTLPLLRLGWFSHESGEQRRKLKKIHTRLVNWIQEGNHPSNWLSLLSQFSQEEDVKSILGGWTGLDYKNLVEGMQEVFQSYLSHEDPLEHPSGAQAAILNLLASREGKNEGVTNLFCIACYSRRLYPIARSLSISFNSMSQSPVTAFAVEFPQGQHGVFQTLTKSMVNTSVTIVTPKEWSKDIAIPQDAKPLIASTDKETFTLGDLMNAAARGTAYGLTQYATPNSTLTLGTQSADPSSYSKDVGRFMAWMLLTARILREITRLDSQQGRTQSAPVVSDHTPTHTQHHSTYALHPDRCSVQLPDGTVFSWQGALGDSGITPEEMPQVIAKAIEIKLRTLREQEDGQHPYMSQFQVESERLDVYTDLADKRKHLKNIIVIAIGGASNSVKAMICPLITPSKRLDLAVNLTSEDASSQEMPRTNLPSNEVKSIEQKASSAEDKSQVESVPDTLHFLDTNDPEVIAQTLDSLGDDILNTEVVIISNTGDTYETNANEKVIVDAIRKKLMASGLSKDELEDELKERLVVVTGKGKGTLYEDTIDANSRGDKKIPLLEYPKTDGRRAIVSVGLYLAARMGLDIREYVESQRRYLERANLNEEQIQHLQKLQLELTSHSNSKREQEYLNEALDILENDPGLLHGVMENYINQKHDRYVSQTIFFSPVYSNFLDWHAHQLNNESLGKPDIKRIALSWLSSEAISQLSALLQPSSGGGQSVFTLVSPQGTMKAEKADDILCSHFRDETMNGDTRLSGDSKGVPEVGTTNSRILFEIIRESLRSHSQPFFTLEYPAYTTRWNTKASVPAKQADSLPHLRELTESSYATQVMFWLSSVIANAASFSGAQGTLVTSYGEDAVSKSRELTALAVNHKRNRSSQVGISDALENFEIKSEERELIHWFQLFAQMGPKLEYTIKEDPDYFRRPHAQARKLVEDTLTEIRSSSVSSPEHGSLYAAVVLDPLTKRPIFVDDTSTPNNERRANIHATGSDEHVHTHPINENGKYIVLAIPADNLENVHLTGGAVGSIMAIFDVQEGLDFESQRLGYDNLRMAYWYLHGAGSNPVVTIFSRRGETRWAYAYDYILAPDMTLIPKPLVGKDTHQIRMPDSKPGTVFFVEGRKSQFAPTFFRWWCQARKKKIKLRNLKGLVANYYGVRGGGLMGIYLTEPEAVVCAALFKAGIRGDVLVVDENGQPQAAEELGTSLGQLKRYSQQGEAHQEHDLYNMQSEPPQRYIYAGDPLRINDLREHFARALQEGRSNENLPINGPKALPSLKDIPLSEQPRTPLKQFLLQHRETIPEEVGELALITLDAANKFSDEYNNVDVGEGTGTRNVSHEEQEKGDQRANEIFKDAYFYVPHLIHKIVSEEEKRTLILEHEDQFVVSPLSGEEPLKQTLQTREFSMRKFLESAFRLRRFKQRKCDRYNIGIDPLDGATNVKTGLPSGTFVAIFNQAEERLLSISLVQGSRTLILAVRGLGTYLFRWDGKHSNDYVLLDKLQKPSKPLKGALKIASIGGSEAGYVGKTGKELFSNPEVIQLIDGWVDDDFDIGHNNQGLVNDLVQICLGTAWGLYKEAVFVYGEQEETQANPSKNDYGGKMRLASEIASTALAMEEMGLNVAIGPHESIHDVTIDLNDPELAKVTYPYSFGTKNSVKGFLKTQLPHYVRRGLGGG